ncbi:MAG TPA: XRE family transcriptional regulator [Candidatus Acidoferrales bacterium]
MAGKKYPTSEWVPRILQLRQRLGLNQSEFAARLNYSAMALSRWESGTHEPTAEAYVQMGNLAEGKDSNWFWTRAGLKSADLSRMFPEGSSILHKENFPDFEIVVAGSGGKRASPSKKTKLVAIPVLEVHAGTHGAKGDQVLDLNQAEVSEMIAAPALWCPNPSTTSCLRVRGSSMSPMIDDGDIVVVDASQNAGKELNGKIIVAWHKTTGLTLSRFLMMKGVQLLESENRDYKPISMARDRNWRIVGKVLWWIRKSP